MRLRVLVSLAASVSVWLASAASSAQPYPPAPYAAPNAPSPYPYYPPPAYGPPPAYVPPPQYAPPTYAPSPRIKYEPGMAPPRGYHLEENPRKGLVISG